MFPHYYPSVISVPLIKNYRYRIDGDVNYLNTLLIFNVAIFSELSSGCYNTIAQNGDYCAGIRVGHQLELQPGAGPQLLQEQPGARGTVQGRGANTLFPIVCNRSSRNGSVCVYIEIRFVL